MNSTLTVEYSGRVGKELNIMAKWKVTLEAIVEAETRVEAWKISRQIFEQDLDYIAQVMAISSQPVPKPAEWLAINEQSPLHRTPQILARLKG